MRRKGHSSIDDPAVQPLVHDLLEANATYREIIDAVLLQTGKVLTTSALSRYRQHWSARKASEEAMGQQLDRLTALLKDNPDLDLKQGALALFWKKLIQRMADADATFDDAGMLDLGHLLIKATRLGQTKEQLDLQRERLELIKRKATRAAEKVEQELQSAGVSRDKIVEMVDQILGVAA